MDNELSPLDDDDNICQTTNQHNKLVSLALDISIYDAQNTSEKKP